MLLAIQEAHIRWAQDVLQKYFESEVVTFAPHGGVGPEATFAVARCYGLRYVAGARTRVQREGVTFGGDNQLFCLQDCDTVMNGVEWLASRLEELSGRRLCTVREMAALNAERAPRGE